MRLNRVLQRIRLETGTTGEERARELAAHGKTLSLPKYFESEMRLLVANAASTDQTARAGLV
jgi:hypothetical protein